MLENRIWNIISPYDIPDLSPEIQVRLKPNRSKSANNEIKRSYSPSPSKSRKSLPKPIEISSHILTPTKSSILKSKETQRTLTKSKSSKELIDTPRKKEKNKERKSIQNITVNELEKFEYLGDTPVVKKTSNPKNLEIDTEIIEKEYISPINYKPLPIDMVKLDTLNYYSSPFTIKEAISYDMLTGKIYQSERLIQNYMLVKPSAKRRAKSYKTNRKSANSFNFEVDFPDESSESNANHWKDFKAKIISLANTILSKVVPGIIAYKSQHSQKKINKKLFVRQPRTLKDVSIKIGKMIEGILLKKTANLQSLIENTCEVPKLNLNFPLQYCQSQEFFVDLFLYLWEFKVKPLSIHGISVYLECDRLISEIHKQKDPTLKLQHILSFIPLLIITWRIAEAKEYIDQCMKIANFSKPLLIWQAWIELLTGKNTTSIYYSLIETNAPPNMSIQYKIAMVYCFYYSCLFRSASRTIVFLKGQNLAEWENLIIADLYMKNNDKASEEIGINTFEQIVETSSSQYIKFLAIYKLFHIFKGYNQYSKALDLIKKAQKLQFSENLKLLIEVCFLKISALFNSELSLQSEVPLLKYQYARLTLKYNLKSPLHKVLKCINDSCGYAQLYSLSVCQFPVNFWKFVLFKKLGVHKLAAKQAICTMDFEPNDKIKVLAINEFLKNIENARGWLDSLALAVIKKDLSSMQKMMAMIEGFDNYMHVCIGSILNNNIENKENIPIHKFEGYFLIWANLYKSSKGKEKQFKGLKGQEEIDKRDKKHPLHVLAKIKRDWIEISWIYENSLSISSSLLWILFGKQIGNFSLKCMYRIMQAKSLLRTSIPRALHKLQKGEKSSMNSYYQAKLSISMIKFQKTASDSSFQKIFALLKDFSIADGISNEYQIKVLYLQAELSFMAKDYQNSYNFLSEAEAYSSMIGSKYLTKKKRALNLDILRQRLNA